MLSNPSSGRNHPYFSKEHLMLLNSSSGRPHPYSPPSLRTGVPAGVLRDGPLHDAQVRPAARHRPADLPVGAPVLHGAGGGGGGGPGAGRPGLPALAGQGLPQPGARQRPGLLRQVPRADAAGQAGQPGDGADGRQGRDGDQGIVQL